MKIKDFLAEFCEDHFPQEFGPWVGFDDHDPAWTNVQIRDMAINGVIDVDWPNDRYRLTTKATALMRPNVLSQPKS